MIWSTFDLEVITPKTINLYPSLTIIVGLNDFKGRMLNSKAFETIKCCMKSFIAILTICKRNLFVKIQSTYQIQEKWNRKNINYVAGKIRDHRTLFFTRLSARTISPSVHVNFPATYLAANLFDWSAIKPNAFQKDIKPRSRTFIYFWGALDCSFYFSDVLCDSSRKNMVDDYICYERQF